MKFRTGYVQMYRGSERSRPFYCFSARRLVYVGFVVDKVATRQVFSSPTALSFACHYHSNNGPHSLIQFIHHGRYLTAATDSVIKQDTLKDVFSKKKNDSILFEVSFSMLMFFKTAIIIIITFCAYVSE